MHPAITQVDLMIAEKHGSTWLGALVVIRAFLYPRAERSRSAFGMELNYEPRFFLAKF